MRHFDQPESPVPEPSPPVTTALFGLSLQQLTPVIQSFAQAPYRSRQLFHALYRSRASQIDEISTLPFSLRRQLTSAGYVVGLPELESTFISIDGTERYLVRCSDGELVETVWMPEGDGGEIGDGTQSGEDTASDPATSSEQPGTPRPATRSWRRATICVSSQVGCAVNCQFCLTAKLGIRRNLTPGEIAGQVVAVLNHHAVDLDSSRINLVFMGMGEPFLNYDNFIAAVRLLVEGVGIPESRMTVSTSGILPGILRLASEPVRPKLALSLNASNDEVREAIMPITRKWDIASLIDALRQFRLRPGERLTFEYVLLGGVNDQPRHARELAALAERSGMPVKINLIAWNSGPDVPYAEPEPAAVSRFQQMLIDRGIPTFIRKPRGRDIYAACGQLKRTVDSGAHESLVQLA